jgi:hypothetical protein
MRSKIRKERLILCDLCPEQFKKDGPAHSRHPRIPSAWKAAKTSRYQLEPSSLPCSSQAWKYYFDAMQQSKIPALALFSHIVLIYKAITLIQFN